MSIRIDDPSDAPSVFVCDRRGLGSAGLDRAADQPFRIGNH